MEKGFDYLYKKRKTLEKRALSYGGDGESRTRVRKSIPETFYECSLSIVIPYKTADKQASFSVAL